MINSLQTEVLNLFQTSFYQNSPFVFLIAFLAGILASLTPCTYPMIPVMIGAFQKFSKGSIKKGFYLSIVYVGTFSLLYILLGLFAALSGVFMGKMASSPWVNLFFAVFIFFLSFSMFGFYEFRIPALNLKGDGIIHMIFLGALSSVVFSACAVPVLATILLFVAHTKSIYFGTLLLASFSLGMGMLFILCALLGGKIWFKSGRFLKVSKIILGIFVLIVSIYFFMRFLSLL